MGSKHKEASKKAKTIAVTLHVDKWYVSLIPHNNNTTTTATTEMYYTITTPSSFVPDQYGVNRIKPSIHTIQDDSWLARLGSYYIINWLAGALCQKRTRVLSISDIAQIVSRLNKNRNFTRGTIISGLYPPL